MQARIIASQPSERQAHLSTCLDKLMTDVQRNLDSKNRDKFTQVRCCPSLLHEGGCAKVTGVPQWLQSSFHPLSCLEQITCVNIATMLSAAFKPGITLSLTTGHACSAFCVQNLTVVRHEYRSKS